ncbi:MAG: hypothetical protein CBHOC_5434, partial [uncultured Caballeronia sp.]
WDQALVPRTWMNFTMEFKMKFMLSIVQEQRVAAFSRCCQGTRSVAEYEKHFSTLAQLVPEMVATELRKIHRFIQGLNVEIQGILAATPVKSYAEVVEKALQIESAKTLERNDRGKRKSVVEDSYGVLGEAISVPKVARGFGVVGQIGVSKEAGSLGFVARGAQASGPSGEKGPLKVASQGAQFEGRCHFC